MISTPTPEETRQQSLACYHQWKDIWQENAKFHGTRFPMKPLSEFINIGIGKAALCIANGYSFEENIETIKKNQHNVDIIACDKTIMHCIENGIIPKFCIVCDANVSYEKYLEPIKEKLKDTILIINVCANTKWAISGNWKDIFFFVSMDVLNTEHIFSGISGCQNIIPAATNVSSQMVVILTQSNNHGVQNFFGYDKYLLIGFDYSWGENYYAFDKDGGGKINYMKNIYLKNIRGDLCCTSSNLMFSARWFESYLRAFRLPIFQCSDRSIVSGIAGVKDLENEMLYSYRPEDSQFVKKLVTMKKELSDRIAEIDLKMTDIAFDHMSAIQAY